MHGLASPTDDVIPRPYPAIERPLIAPVSQDSTIRHCWCEPGCSYVLQLEPKPAFSCNTPHTTTHVWWTVHPCMCLGLFSSRKHILIKQSATQVLTSLQSALQLVHAYPYLIEPSPLLDTLAEKHGQLQNGTASFASSDQQKMLVVQWDALLVYISRVTSKDCFEYVPMTSVQNPFPDSTPRSLTSILAAQQRAAQASLQGQGSQLAKPVEQHALPTRSLQGAAITVPSLEALLDDVTAWSGGHNLRRGYNHADAMPKDHQLVSLLCKGIL